MSSFFSSFSSSRFEYLFQYLPAGGASSETKQKNKKQKKGASGWSGEVAERHLADKTQTKFKTVGIAALHLSEDRKESGNNLPRLNGWEWNGNEFKAGKNGGKDQRWSFFFSHMPTFKLIKWDSPSDDVI